MSRPATDTDVMALTNMHFEDCKTVLEFMQTKVRPVIERFSKNDHADGTVKGAFLRAQAWLATFSKLDDPSHFQAVIAGTRTLFEIAIDLTLMHHDRTAYPVEKMFAWEESAKLKAAERTRDFYANAGRSVPDHLEPRVDFIARQDTRIAASRLKWWPRADGVTGRHPDRWTGRSLPEDASAADAFAPYGFREFYDGRFAELCWGTHGSGLAGVRYLTPEAFPGICAMAFEDAAEFAMQVSRFVLLYFGKFDEILQARFRQIEEERAHWRQLAFKTQKEGKRPEKPAP